MYEEEAYPCFCEEGKNDKTVYCPRHGMLYVSKEQHKRILEVFK